MKGAVSVPANRHATAFARVDLAATLAAAALLVTLALSSHATMEADGERALCLSNLRQLTQAWNGFATDNAGVLPGNEDGGGADPNTNWCVGRLDLAAATPDNTNILNLLNAQLGRYVTDVSIYKCPSDRSVAPGTGGLPRVRSISMNGYMGEARFTWTAGYRRYRRLSEITAPTPAEAFVFIDEREDSMYGAAFYVSMSGFSPTNPEAYSIIDYPASYHNRAGNLSFADGHAETWRWSDSRTIRFGTPGQSISLNIPSPNNPDVARIQAATSRPIK
jgi:prepilin-type processing-associated H-X9-DG protein